MRRIIPPQLLSGEIDISAIQLDPDSRDDIPQILLGLQHIYTEPELQERVFNILTEIRPERVGEGAVGKASAHTGRPGMEQWKILVLGVLRLGLNTDYDRIQELANQHSTIRQMLGHNGTDNFYYPLQTLKDNLRLFTPEILDRINQEVVREGHRLVKKTPEEPLNARADLFVVETHVHFHTDISLLLDAVRKILGTCGHLCEELGRTEWRQSAYQARQFKKAYRKLQRLSHSTSKNPEKRKARRDEIDAAYRAYLEQAEGYIFRARNTREQLQALYGLSEAQLADLDGYIAHAERQIDQIRRRVLQGETIPHAEKVFSIFQPHTEWNSKGKAGVPVELGLPVCVVEDRYGFILHHLVMEGTTDKDVAVPLVDAILERFPEVKIISFDKGFHSPANQIALAERLDQPALPLSLIHI